jgi:beta-glucosidase-like glycosyl hydrolase/CubicO group peptidase (beta-lactamase class C family)
MPSVIRSHTGRSPSNRTQSIPRAAAEPSARLTAEAEAWVRNTLRQMSLEEKIGQLVMVACWGGFLPTDGDEFRGLVRLVEEEHAGGLMIATRPGALGIELSQVYPTAALVNAMQQRARIPLLVAGDFERGTAFRLREGTSFPHAMAVAATGRPEDAYTMGRITAIEARAAGVPWIFAPVVDVNSNPANPIINVRAFGEEPKQIEPFLTAFIRGVEENGGLSTAKHFPGHGDTDQDSHTHLPTVAGDRARLDRVELPPFRAAIEAGVSTVMTGHLAVPALEPDVEVPATISERITSGVLRREMGFEGVVVTDSLDMAGVAAWYSAGEAAVRAILAGSDLLLALPDAEPALAGLRDAASSGRLPVDQIDRAVTRVLRAKAQLGLHKNRQVSLDSLGDNFGRAEFAAAAQEIADRGVTVLRNGAGLLPLDSARPMRALLVIVAGDPDRSAAEAFEREVRPRVDELRTVRYDTRYNPVGPGGRLELPPADSYDVLIVAMCVRVTDRKGSLGLPADQLAAVHHLLALGKPAVAACFGNPYLIAQFPEAKTWLAVFSNADVAQRAGGRALFGQVAVGGKIPVSVPGVVTAGSGVEVPANPMKLIPSAEMGAKLAPAHALLDRAVGDGAFPGGVLAVGHGGRLAVHAFGKQSYEAGAAAVTPETIYDTASLTKPVATATLAAVLTELGVLDLSAPVVRYLPEWRRQSGDWRSQVTVRHLLTHTSGLAAHREFFKAQKTRREVIAAALSEAPEAEPGAASVYSDIGFILLGEILERLTGQHLDEAAQQRIFAPLGMAATMFNPAGELRARIAPTEIDAVLRKRLAHGEVHDENTWVMDGVAGHAGMFSTAGDLAIVCRMMLNGGQYAHRRLLKRATVAQFTAADPLTGNTRTMGWNVPSANSSSGRYFSPRSFGHLGFTGTSMWIDPDKELFVVLLTNRVNPTRQNDKIQQVRPALHDSIVAALGLAGPPRQTDPPRRAGR